MTLLCAALAPAAGCGPKLPPTPVGLPVSAFDVGDRARVAFDEVAFSVPFHGASTPYQNLHVAVTAFVNPAHSPDSRLYEAQTILRRCDARIAARLTEVMAGIGEQSIGDTDRLRKRMAAEAQGVVDDTMRQWKLGSEYRVEIVVTRLYWTDPSVGAPEPRRRPPWDWGG